MAPSSSRSAWPWIAGQITLSFIAVAGLTIAPPVRGRMLLVPIVAGAPVARVAVDHGALIVGRARGDAIVVQGDAVRLVGPLWRAGILTVAGWPVDCGAFVGRA